MSTESPIFYVAVFQVAASIATATALFFTIKTLRRAGKTEQIGVTKKKPQRKDPDSYLKIKSISFTK